MGAFDFGSDHVVLIDGEVGIPTVFFECWPDDFYHTNMDTPDKSDSTQLKRVAFIGAASAVTFACAKPKDAVRIASETYSRSEGRISEDLKKALTLMSKSPQEKLYEAYRNAHIIIKQGYLREIETLESLKLFAENDRKILNYIVNVITKFKSEEKGDQEKIRDHYEILCGYYNQKPKKFELTKDEIEMSKMIPERTSKEIPSRRRLRVKTSSTNSVTRIRYGPFEALNFVDGKRSILDIAHALYSEYGGGDPADMKEFIMAHVKAGNLRIK